LIIAEKIMHVAAFGSDVHNFLGKISLKRKAAFGSDVHNFLGKNSLKRKKE